MDRTVRVRSLVWFVVGVVTAVSGMLVVARQWPASAAASHEDAATFVPMVPCRLFDYRPTPFTVGDRNVPLGPGETYVQQVTGDIGDCAVPSDATAVAMNVTITEPTAPSFLTIFPADVATVPTVSSLNWAAGQTPTPNKVDVQLSPRGRIKLYNRFGQVFVLADVVGYYTTTAIDDLRIELTDLRTDLRRLNSFWRSWNGTVGSVDIGSDWTEIAKISVIDDEPWNVTLFANGTLYEPDDGETVECGFSGFAEPVAVGSEKTVQWQSPVGADRAPLSLVGQTGTYTTPTGPLSDGSWHLVCRNIDGGQSRILEPKLYAHFSAYENDELLHGE